MRCSGENPDGQEYAVGADLPEDMPPPVPKPRHSKSKDKDNLGDGAGSDGPYENEFFNGFTSDAPATPHFDGLPVAPNGVPDAVPMGGMYPVASNARPASAIDFSSGPSSFPDTANVRAASAMDYMRGATPAPARAASAMDYMRGATPAPSAAFAPPTYNFSQFPAVPEASGVEDFTSGGTKF